MTQRRYYDDPSSRDFQATILRVSPRADRRAVWLDRSAFYPTSGGQPFDTGTLADLRVVEVVDEDDDVVHIVEGPTALEAGQAIAGRIDWPRRVDHMQQHTGQHILSAAFVSGFAVPTVSFHLGATVSTIDLQRELTPAQIAAAEDEANRIVWEDRPITIRYATAGEAAALPLRKESSRAGTLRLIEIADCDLSACGGTHVSRTGGVGLISVQSWERFKGGMRLEFVCGGRALTRLRALRDQSSASVKLLSVLPADVPATIERLQSEAREARRTITTLQGELAVHQAAAMVDAAETRGWGRLVAVGVDYDAAGLKSLASAIVSRAGLLAVLVSTSTPALVVVARAADVPVACDDIVRRTTARFGGRGGGRPDLAQAGGLSGTTDEILSSVRELIP